MVRAVGGGRAGDGGRTRCFFSSLAQYLRRLTGPGVEVRSALNAYRLISALSTLSSTLVLLPARTSHIACGQKNEWTTRSRPPARLCVTQRPLNAKGGMFQCEERNTTAA